MYNCCICKSPLAQIHHIFYGNSNRKLSDNYNLIIPLCETHHKSSPTGNDAHRKKEFYQRLFCRLMSINYEVVNRSINLHAEDVKARDYLKKVSVQLDGFLERYLT